MPMPCALRRPFAVLAASTLVLTAASCSSDDGQTSTDTSAPPTTAVTTTATSQAPSTSEATSTSGTPSTSAPTTTETDVPATVELRFDGVGSATLGQDADAAIAALSADLGEPGESRDWVQPSCELAGPDSDGARSVVWGGLIVTFSGADESSATFTGWTYRGGAAGTATELGLDTGVTVGDPGDALGTAYGTQATFVPFEVFDAHWEITSTGSTLWAWVDGEAAGDPISQMDLNPQLCE